MFCWACRTARAALASSLSCRSSGGRCVASHSRVVAGQSLTTEGLNPVVQCCLSLPELVGAAVWHLCKWMMGVATCLATTDNTLDLIMPQGYNRMAAPMPADGTPMEVKVSAHITGIYEAYLVQMSLVLSLVVVFGWTDNRLQQVPGANISSTQVPLGSHAIDRLWTPDPFFEGMKDLSTSGILDEVQVMYHPQDQHISISIPLQLNLACPMHFRDYPFDSQQCELTLGTYRFSTRDFRWQWGKPGLMVQERVIHGVSNYHVFTEPTNDTQCLCPACTYGFFPCVKVSFHFKRCYTSYLLSTYVPSALFVAVAWMSYLWPPGVIPGRTGLIITSLLTVISMSATVRKNSPDTSYLKAIDLWMLMCLTLTIFTLATYAIVLRLRQWQKEMKDMAVSFIATSTATAYPEAHGKIKAFKYCRYEQLCESVGFILLPFLFLTFNCVYWPLYLAY